MSLSLLQGYSSEEEEEEEEKAEEFDYYDSDDGGKRRNDQVSDNRYKPLFDPNPSSSSSLPSAFDAFSEVSTNYNSHLEYLNSPPCCEDYQLTGEVFPFVFFPPIGGVRASGIFEQFR